MSSYGEYLPLNANLTIGISLGNIQPAEDSPATADEPKEEQPEEAD